jgi:hypothetical protein
MICSTHRALFIALFLSAAAIFAQNSKPTSDPQALAIVQQALALMGGQAAWTKVGEIGIEGSCTSLNSDGTPAGSSEIHWVQAGNEFRYDATDSGQTTTFVSGHGNPAHTDGQHASAWSRAASEAQKPYFAPALILFQELSGGQYIFEFLGSTNMPASTQTASHVRAVRRVGGQLLRRVTQDWYFDSLTGLPISVEYGLPGESRSDIQAQATMQFSGYTASQGIAMPQHFSIDIAAVASTTCTVTSTAINTSPPSANFDLPVTGGVQ